MSYSNNRNKRVDSARQTLDIIEQGYYIVDNEKIDIYRFVEESVKKTALYSPEYFEKGMNNAENEITKRDFTTDITVKNCTAMEAAEELLSIGGKTGCLNFASAKNPGGGFLGGAQAQEESLARASALYPTQMKYFKELYEYNRAQNTYLYSDYMIYSPDVLFFKDDRDELLAKPYVLDILTSPAVNIGAMEQNNRPDEKAKAKQVMMSRIDKLLSVFVLAGVDNLILGAWGCGVFRNQPEDVARYFAHYLLNDGKYAKCFKNIIFAVFDSSKKQENINAFQQGFPLS
ncbi:TIGR02452 family protein [Dysgonomonas sp. 521]|uniref:TIGR02452 family protein n=1 Tax=Dysgonomonas sp. 521 TaxID=2302932 RepID=UPI0013D16BCA|nr:TIGR02452 family protein [Dysgonomonas sp. 521]NDV93916.1 TIGR02452 family protein [Dysgonomonas sp. 521]